MIQEHIVRTLLMMRRIQSVANLCTGGAEYVAGHFLVVVLFITNMSIIVEGDWYKASSV